MSDRMRQIPFDKLMDWALDEYSEVKQIFGVREFINAPDQEKLQLFGEKLEFPCGPAAGPHTQLAQNIIASYVVGGRFFELKTVQTLDGEDLPVSKPCILAPDECYNVEWSTELYVPQALEEYIKGWFALGLLSKELGLGDSDGYIFNMSVGYDLEGIRSKKIDDFIEGLKNAEHTDTWKLCKQWAKANISKFKNVDEAYIDSISPKICTSITLSTLHGCPPEEIERIATYLIMEKKLNTFIKCNPTLLGYEYARSTLDKLGYDYMAFDDHHFKADLQFEDAIPMLRKLGILAAGSRLAFGVKLTNTFPVKITAGELPGEEMYMSGRSLFPLTLSVAIRLSKAFDGKLRISFSGGADAHNIDALFDAGIWPITMATTLLKPGGYGRLVQMSGILAKCKYRPFEGVNIKKLEALFDNISSSSLYKKPIKPADIRKMKGKAPLLNCSAAPCKESGCPINQDIPAYLRLVGEGKHLEALRVITERNPLPFITGAICPHHCTDGCTRGFYESPVDIRHVKKQAADLAYKELLNEIKPLSASGKKVAIIGGGPAGLAAAYFLTKAGLSVTIFEGRDSLGGIVRHVIPEFRIGNDAINKDIDLVLKMGAEVRLNSEIKDTSTLKKDFDTVIVATGAWKPGILELKEGDTLNALQVLEAMKKNSPDLKLGENVVVIGGGNTAMDMARAAKRFPGVRKVSIVYRRTKHYMPADEEELQLAIQDGVDFCELLAPIDLKDGNLNCEQMKLGKADASGRRIPVATGRMVSVPADVVIAAIGDSAYDDLKGDYVIGDAKSGPATVVEAIADAMDCATAICGAKFDKYESLNFNPDIPKVLSKKGSLCLDIKNTCNTNRCLECSTVCGCCVDVCPNRANVVIRVDGRGQVIHIDAMCNECGNCEMFCPYSGAPYKDKLTYFSYEEDFNDSENNGFLPLVGDRVLLRLDGSVKECSISETGDLAQLLTAALACNRLKI